MHPPAACACGQRVHQEDLRKLPKYNTFVEAAQRRLNQRLCKFCSQRPPSTFHACHCDECLAKEYRTGHRACRYCGSSIEPEQSVLPRCEVCLLKVMRPCVVAKQCCAPPTCVVCQLEVSETHCRHCHATFTAEGQAALQESKHQLEYLAQTEPALFARGN